MDESYIEGRFGIVMEEIRDALAGIEFQLEEINKNLVNFNECNETRTPLKALRVADITRKP
ncbi:MAG: hypothetical protein E3J57_01060 [Dehalococcoidia bacterium]|nr:MAG: hypothetical protein E3J57_01060 [Dehalococcoidia bacterium]